MFLHKEMDMKKTILEAEIAVVIILYKNFNSLSSNEILSLKKGLLIFRKRHFFFIVSESIRWECYSQIIKQYQIQYQISFFSEWFFFNTLNYNQLMFHKEFYRLFDSINYILIYQLDCWVFKDELDIWANLNFDYIGAPLFRGFCKNTDFQFGEGGNGGFSLRNVKKQREILDYLYESKEIYMNYNNVKATNGKLPALFTDRNNNLSVKSSELLISLFEMPELNEDYLWSVLIPNVFTDFKVCSPKLASKFSIEMHPRYLYKMNDYLLPMGVHAWEKYDRDFWLTFIKYDD
jgi:hypothetical protein